MYHHPKSADCDMCIADLLNHYTTTLCYIASASLGVISQILRVDMAKLLIAIVLQTADFDKGCGPDIFVKYCLNIISHPPWRE